MKAGDLLMRTRVLQEKNYAERMQNGVEPYLAAHAEEFYWERESGHPIHVLRYRAFRPRGVEMCIRDREITAIITSWKPENLSSKKIRHRSACSREC